MSVEFFILSAMFFLSLVLLSSLPTIPLISKLVFSVSPNIVGYLTHRSGAIISEAVINILRKTNDCVKVY